MLSQPSLSLNILQPTWTGITNSSESSFSSPFGKIFPSEFLKHTVKYGQGDSLCKQYKINYYGALQGPCNLFIRKLLSTPLPRHARQGVTG